MTQNYNGLLVFAEANISILKPAINYCINDLFSNFFYIHHQKKTKWNGTPYFYDTQIALKIKMLRES